MISFEKEYFNGGSNYTDYRLKKYTGLAEDLIRALPLRPTDKILDYGAATGALIHELKKQGIYHIKGTDISLWAVQEGSKMFGHDTNTLQYYNINLLREEQDWIIALDVLEHLPDAELQRFLTIISEHPPKKGIVIRIPVSRVQGEDFVLDVSKNDRTHLQIRSKENWKELFRTAGFQEIARLVETHIYDSDGVYCTIFGKGG